MRGLGEIRSPLEASVQELCNTRLVEAMCTWTNASLQFPPANSTFGLLPGRPRLTLIRHRRRRTSSPALNGKLAADQSDLPQTIFRMDLRSPSITGTSRK